MKWTHENALASVDLNVTDNTFVNHLSGGMKLAIVETILQEANTLFLDEPTAMLDVDATAGNDLFSYGPIKLCLLSNTKLNIFGACR